jgi:hypothetical protein
MADFTPPCGLKDDLRVADAHLRRSANASVAQTPLEERRA